MTVLSRCLQFNLKNMTRESIVSYLNSILGQEQVPFDEPALWLLAEAANGSMRDALSLTDQAIAYGEGELNETDVATMLGTVDLKRVLHLVKGLIEKDADSLMQQVAGIAEHAPDYRTLLNELLSTLHRVAIAQAAPRRSITARATVTPLRHWRRRRRRKTFICSTRSAPWPPKTWRWPPASGPGSKWRCCACWPSAQARRVM